MRANSFAAAALMPEEDVRRHAERPVSDETFAQLVGYYRVSPDALAWRLKTLQIADSREQRSRLGAMPVQQAALLGGWREEYTDLTRNPKAGRASLPCSLRPQ